MKIKKFVFIAGLLICLLIPWGRLQASASITALGGWSETIDRNDLTAGAGSDLNSTYESSENAAAINITADSTWSLNVKKSDVNWNRDLLLYVKRTSSGSGGSVSGGTSYLQLTDIDQFFFTGSSSVSEINLQLKLSGMSIQISPANYSTKVYFTVQDI
jgi:hypothetical protein